MQPRTKRRAALGLAVAALGSCSPHTFVEATQGFARAVEPLPSALGTEGDRGPYGAGRTTVDGSTRGGLDAVRVEVTYPSDGAGRPDRSRAPYPLVVFVQGGLVPVARYRWLTEHFATRGYVVAAPSHVADLAFFETDNADVAVRAVREASGRGGALLEGMVAPASAPVVVGHSLGGVVATRVWIAGAYSALVLLASYPAEGDPVRARAGSLVLSLVGENDRKAPAATYLEGLRAFAEPRYFFTVADMNHYDWCDGTTAAELATDGPAASDQRAVRRHARAAIDSALDLTLRGVSGAGVALNRGFVGLRSGS